MSDDKIKLQSIIDALYLSPQHYETKQASECEAEIRETFEKFKTWSKNLIHEKIK